MEPAARGGDSICAAVEELRGAGSARPTLWERVVEGYGVEKRARCSAI